MLVAGTHDGKESDNDLRAQLRGAKDTHKLIFVLKPGRGGGSVTPMPNIRIILYCILYWAWVVIVNFNLYFCLYMLL